MMMAKRCLLLAVMVLAAVGMLGVMSLAQTDPGAGTPAGQDRPQARLKAALERLIQELQLTPEQKAQIEQIIQTHLQAAANWQQEHGQEVRSARQDLQKAMQAGDRPAAQKARQEMAKLAASRAEITRNTLKQLKDVLSPDQLEKVQRLLGAPGGAGEPRPWVRVLEDVRQLDLSAEQQQKIRKIRQDALAAAQQAEGLEAKAKVMTDAIEKIKTDVLTDAQRAKLAELLKAAPRLAEDLPGILEGVGLTEQQKAQAKDIWQEAVKKANAEPDKRRQIMREATTRILQDVLTQEQRDKLPKGRDGQAPPPGRAAGPAVTT